MNAAEAKNTVVYYIAINNKICSVSLFEYVMRSFDRMMHTIQPYNGRYTAYRNCMKIAGCNTYDEAEQANFNSAYNNYLENCKQAYYSKKDALETIAEQQECCLADAEQIESGELYYKVSQYDAIDETEDEIFYSLKEAVYYFTNPANQNTQLTRHYCGKQTWWYESHFNAKQLEQLKPFINKRFGKKLTLKTPTA